MSSNQAVPVSERLASKMLDRIRLAGLIHLFLDQGAWQKQSGGEKEKRPELVLLWEEFAQVLPYIDEACALLELGPVQIPAQPFIFNTRAFEPGDPWASDGSDGKRLSLRKLASAYGALWDMQEDGPNGATNRIVKGAVWFSEQQKNKGAAFRLVLSLLHAGFLSRSHALGLAVVKLAKLFSVGQDHSEILRLDFTEKGQQRADRLVRHDGFNRAFCVEIGQWLLDETIRSIARARVASNPDEWITRVTETLALITATQFFEAEFKVANDFPQPYGVQFMALEEIRCDFSALFIGMLDERSAARRARSDLVKRGRLKTL